jgi:hypothetical protein
MREKSPNSIPKLMANPIKANVGNLGTNSLTGFFSMGTAPTCGIKSTKHVK